jgi:hypothetical protein
VGGCVAPAVAEKLVCLEGNLLIKHRCFRTMADGRRYQILGLEEERLPSLMDKVENVLDLEPGTGIGAATRSFESPDRSMALRLTPQS